MHRNGIALSVTVLLAGLVAQGCIRHVRQRLPAPAAIQPAPVTRSAGRRLAVAFVQPGVLPVYESTASSNVFHFQDAQQFYVAAFQAALAGRVGALDFVSGAPPPGYHGYLYPQLEMSVHFEAGFFNRVSCRVRYTLIAADSAGQVIARQSADAEQTFVLIGRANDACRMAMEQAFVEASWPVLQAVDAR